MFCPECKAELPDDAKFCIRCGYDFTRIKTPPPEQKSSILDRLRTSPRPDEPGTPSDSGETLKKGEVFARRYRILSEGKRGGMGVVYKCEDQKLNRTVALKIIHPRLLSSEQAVKRFRQEVSISLELLHRNIVRVHNLDEYEGIEFFTMEWVEGKSLREILNERVKERQPFNLEEAYTIISQLSDALQYAHRHTIHRDIKPENILTYEDEEGLRIKVTDFGIAKMLTPAQFTTTSLQIGTPYYMAPEQKVDAAHVDKRADIYAVGVVLFELLTLENTIGLEMPSEINPDLPKEIDAIIKRAIATRAENRYADIKQLVDGLGNVVGIWKQRVEEERKRVEGLKKKEQERLRREAEEVEKRKQEEERKREQEEERKRRIESLLTNGKLLLNEGKVEKAIEAFGQVLRIDSENKEGVNLLERAKSEKNKAEELRRKEEEKKRWEEEQKRKEEKRKREEEERIRKEAEEKKRAEEAKERELWLIERGKESENAGKYQEALNYYREANKKSIYVSAKDSIREVEKKIKEEEEKERKKQEEERQLAEERKRSEEAERKRKEEEEARRKKRNTALWSGLAVIGIVLLIIYFGYRKSETPQVTPTAPKEETTQVLPSAPASAPAKPAPGQVPKEAKPTEAPTPVPALKEELFIHPKPGELYRDPFTSMEFVWVPEGKFQMGDDFGDGNDNERPIHEVYINGFWIGKCEVKVSEFRKFVDDTGYKSDAERGGGAYVRRDNRWELDPSKNWRSPGFGQDGNHPVVCVSWNDADEYAKWLSKKSGRKFRLPTEAEWEYAAKSGGRKEKWAGTNSEGDIAEYVWFSSNAGGRTHPVGQKRPNDLGLFDMSGNVWEWCQDWYDRNYFNQSPRENPEGPRSGQFKVVRGGSWIDIPINIRTSYRFGPTPGPSWRDFSLGFRLVLPSQ